MQNLLRIRKKDFLYLVVFLLLILLYAGCGNNENKNSNTQTSRYDDVEKVREMITDSKMTSLQQVVGDTIKITEQSVFLIYTGYDCGNCIEKGFEIIKRFDKKNTDVYVIASNADILTDQHRYDYKKYIFRDSKDLVRKQLKFYYSPAILFMRENMKPARVFFPGLDNEKTMNVD